MRTAGVTLVATLLISAGSASAQTAETGFLNRSVVVDGTEYRYQVYVPREFTRSTPWPIILALHGGGEYGRDGLLQTDVGLARAIRRNADRFPAIVVFPQSPPGGTPGFQALGGRIALAALDKSMAEFGADPSRVYLTGLSMGGNGAWYLAYHHPDRFAALVVVCGFIEAFTGAASGVRYPAIVASDPDAFAAIALRVSRIPIWIFHGDADTVVAVEVSRRMASALKSAGATVQYTELPGVGHNSWDPAYGSADLADWLFKQRKAPPPVPRRAPSSHARTAGRANLLN
jgi:predicted peptidase